MPLLKSCVTSANTATCPFPLNNLPYGVFAREEDEPHCGVAMIMSWIWLLLSRQGFWVIQTPGLRCLIGMTLWN